MLRLRVPLEIKSVDDTGTFTGYGSTFGNVDLGNDVCVKGCFQKSLDIMKAEGRLPSMFYNHNDNEPVGDWLEAKEDDHGLFVKGMPWVGKGIPKAEQANCLVRGTGRKGLSIGFITTKKEITTDGIRKLLEVELLEVSIVPFPMNPSASVLSVKSALRNADGSVTDPRTFERVLRDELALSAKEAKALMSRGYKGLAEDARDAVDSSTEFSELLALINNNIKALRG